MNIIRFFPSALLLISVLFFSCEDQLHEVQAPLADLEESPAATAWQTVWQDQFNGDLGKWQKTQRYDYNSNLCFYSRNNPKIVNFNGTKSLQLVAWKNGGQYNSGHVKSNYSFNPRNGDEFRVYAKILFTAVQGSQVRRFKDTYGAWPAFWTVNEGVWPRKGEIDIMEAYTRGGYVDWASNLFYGTQPLQNQLNNVERPYNVSDQGWHYYNLYWRKDYQGRVTVRIVVDGQQRAWYSNQSHPNLRLENFGPHNIIFNLNVGSNNNLGIFDNSRINLFSNAQMYVDWVKVDKRRL